MNLIKIEDFNTNKINLLDKIFIYPTDTIYGIGCDAENPKLVNKIRKIKQRSQKPFSIIAPDIDFILNNFETNIKTIKKYLPGPYTLILKKKNPNFLKAVSNTEFVGVRIPNSKFTKILQKTGKPIVTTSVNISGEKFANKISEINSKIANQVEFIIDSGELSGKPSTIIWGEKIIERK